MIISLQPFFALPSSLTLLHRSIWLMIATILILAIIPRTRMISIGCFIVITIIVSSKLLIYPIAEPRTTPYPSIVWTKEWFTDEAGILTTQPLALKTNPTLIIPSTSADPHLHLWDHNTDTLYQATGPLILVFPSREVQRGTLYEISLDSLTPEEKNNLWLTVKAMLVEHYFPGSSLPIRYLSYARYRFLSEWNYDRWWSTGREVRERGRKLGELPGWTGSLITNLIPLGQWVRNDSDSDLTTQTIKQSRREWWNRVNQ